MSYFAGDLKEITINHPTVGSLTLQVKAGEVATYDLGGIRTTDVKTTGSGTSIRQQNVVPWSVEAVIAWDMLTQIELQKMILLASSTVEGTYTFGNINGSVYQGMGSPIGDLKADTQMSTFPVKFSGGGVLKKIA